MENIKLWVALPIYNEWPALKSLIENLEKTLDKDFPNYQIVICDDGSTDNGREYLNNINQKNITVIRHYYNRGLAEAIKDIFEYISRESDPKDYIIRMDGDATHNPIYLKKMIDEMSDNFDVVIASRTSSNDKELSFTRNLYSTGAKYFVRLFFPVPKISEYTGGFRGYKASILHKALEVYGGSFIQLGSFGFVCTFEKLVKLNLIGAKFTEVPFELEYQNKTGKSKMVPWITILGYILLIPVIYWPNTGWKKRTKLYRD